ncbi:MAG: HAD family hydrolase [Bdellovibrionales bacterium]|nr:HAD family hydrolase [Bdellovibrionales bacterium]
MAKNYLVLDLDDTIYDAEAAYCFALSAIGIDPLDNVFIESRQLIKSRLGMGHVAARNRILYFKQFLETKNRYSHSAVLSLMETYEEKLCQHISAQWKNLGRDELFLGKLNHIPKVVLTNENLRTQVLKLRAMDPKGTIFPHVLTSEEMGVEKPDLSLFSWALKKLNCSAADCLMVGDSLENDVAPALKLGISSALTTEFKKTLIDEPIPHFVKVLRSLNDLEALLT